MAKTTISCPNCRQMISADIDQLFDVSSDPTAKQRLLSGAYNLVRCPMCGYQGTLATPILYHDADKELLLTFVPPELGLPRNEQERLIGNLMNQVINKLPQEKRKGYLLRPQSTLTMQGLVERVLEADGITREMVQAQQQRLSLIQRLASASDPQVLEEIARQEDALIDGDFFNLINRLAEAALVNGDQNSARALGELQRRLLPITTFGRQVQAQSQELEAAIQDLKSAGEEMTREKLLTLLENAPNETRLSALVSLGRPALDYEFFQLLSNRIERASKEDRPRLENLRARLLEMTQAIDQQLQAHVQQIRKAVETIAASPDVAQTMMQNLRLVDEYFINELTLMMNDARSKGDLERSGKYQQMMDVIQRTSAPPEMALIEDYLDIEDDTARLQFLKENGDRINTQFMELLANIVAQVQAGGEPELIDHVNAANRQAIRFNMQRNLSG